VPDTPSRRSANAGSVPAKVSFVGKPGVWLPLSPRGPGNAAAPLSQEHMQLLHRALLGVQESLRGIVETTRHGGAAQPLQQQQRGRSTAPPAANGGHTRSASCSQRAPGSAAKGEAVTATAAERSSSSSARSRRRSHSCRRGSSKPLFSNQRKVEATPRFSVKDLQPLFGYHAGCMPGCSA
jgi:hypothetical protein